jgi:hypothetical protein
MSDYMTRVELHNANWSDYEKLHTYMGRLGFDRTITSGQGKKYQLPQAEYYLSGSALSQSEVLERAKSAAAQTQLEFEVIVTTSNGCTWYGLKSLAGVR